MSRRRRKADDLTRLAAEVAAEDGGDPKEFHAKPCDAPQQAGRQGRQLCSLVKDALRGVLADCADAVLQGLAWVSVEPARTPGDYRCCSRPGTRTASRCKPRSARAAGFLRAEVRRR